MGITITTLLVHITGTKYKQEALNLWLIRMVSKDGSWLPGKGQRARPFAPPPRLRRPTAPSSPAEFLRPGTCAGRPNNKHLSECFCAAAGGSRLLSWVICYTCFYRWKGPRECKTRRLQRDAGIRECLLAVCLSATCRDVISISCWIYDYFF